MKKVLLAGTALLGLAAISTPAAAEVNLDLGGYFRGYGVYADNDEPAGLSLREFDFRRDTEIHFSGETTTDGGLTLGVHYELAVGGPVDTDEAYLYFSGQFGRLNFGSEDGAAYLLQVAAPSADSNVDGMRVYIQGLETDLWDDNLINASVSAGTVLEYDHADFENTDRLTYLTPKWNGFQAGVSYAPEAGQNAVGNNLAGMASDNDLNQYEDLWEVGARWDGEFEGFGISLGAGFSTADVENGVAVLVGDASGDLQTWNAGLNVTFGAFSVGAAYLAQETEVAVALAPQVNDDAERDTWVVGLGWDNGPYHLGASYLSTDFETAGADVLDAERFTIGGGMTYSAGATLRGAVAFGEADPVGALDTEFVQVTVGTDVQF